MLANFQKYVVATMLPTRYPHSLLLYRYSPYLCGMFIKVTKSKNYNYLQIVESYREGSNTRHRVIANLGRYDELQGNEQIMRLANRLLKIAGQDPEELQFEELQRLHYGHKVYEKHME